MAGESSVPAPGPLRVGSAYRLLLVSNRGPISYEVTRDGRLRPTRGSGGLVTAFEGIQGQWPLTWIACAMTEGDRRVAGSLAALVPEPARAVGYDAAPCRRWRSTMGKMPPWRR